MASSHGFGNRAQASTARSRQNRAVHATGAICALFASQMRTAAARHRAAAGWTPSGVRLSVRPDPDVVDLHRRAVDGGALAGSEIQDQALRGSVVVGGVGAHQAPIPVDVVVAGLAVDAVGVRSLVVPVAGDGTR